MVIYEGDSANEIWLKIASDIVANRHTAQQMSRSGCIHEIKQACISLKTPSRRWVYSRFPPINPAFALAEIVWIMAGTNESKILNFWNPALPKYAGKGETYYGAYGYRLKKNLGFDQLERAYRTLEKNPISRQAVLQIWDGRHDLPKSEGLPNNEDIPCNVCSMLKIRDGKLDWTQVVRSNDLFLGLPYNFVQFTMLQEIVAGWLGVEIGEYNQLSDSLHLYEEHTPMVTQSLTTGCFGEIQNSRNEKHKEPFCNSKKHFTSMYKQMRSMATASNCDTLNSSINTSMPQPFLDMMYIIGADAARRHGFFDLAIKYIYECKNHTYRILWANWIERYLQKICNGRIYEFHTSLPEKKLSRLCDGWKRKLEKQTKAR